MNLPWYIEQHTNSLGATLKDNIGNVVAMFTDYKKAEYFLEAVNEYEKLEDENGYLKEKNNSLEEKNYGLIEKNEGLIQELKDRAS